MFTGILAPVHAQSAPAAGSATFEIKGFKLHGENPLGESKTSQVLAPFVQAKATIDTLQQATAALETALRDAGYGLHRVALPPQEIGEQVRLDIVKFTMGKVTLEGNQQFGDANIRRSLPELKEGTTPNFNRLSVQTTIANENLGKQVQVALKESEEPDKVDAKVVVKETKPWNFSASLSNAGAVSSGRDRLTVTAGHSNLFDRDHQFVGAYTTSIERTSDVKQLGLSYRAPMYQWGGVIGASYTQSDVVGSFGSFSSTGAGHTLGVSYTSYLPAQGGSRDYFSFGLDDKVFDVAKINGIAATGQVARRSRSINTGYTRRVESDTAVWGFNAEFVAGVPGGSGNSLSAFVTEDPRISTARWKAVRGGGNYSAGFAGNWVWTAKLQGQYSPDALISGEQFGTGGSSSVRGMGERPVSGDKGVFGSIEITTPEMAPGLRWAGFFDAAQVENNNPNATNKPPRDSIASVGLGLRYGVNQMTLTADYARVLNGSVVPTANVSKGDDKLHLNMAVRF